MDKSRCLAAKIDRLLAMFPVVAVIGPRQCGKSTLVRNLRPDWDYYDLENPADYQLLSDDPGGFLDLHPERIIIDEAQQYPELFKVLRGVVDADRRHKGRFLLTGSSSPEIVRGITESLAGRIAITELWPFKQCEFYDQPLPDLYQLLVDPDTTPRDFTDLNTSLEPAQSLHLWARGGFPEPLLEGAHDPQFHWQWMENFIGNYLGRDIRSLFPRLNIHNFRRFLTLLAQFSGHQLNMSAMARALEVSVATIRDYLDIIHQTFLWRNLPPYLANPLKKVQKADKGFFRDPGMLHYLLRINDPDRLLLHPVAGFSFESFVSEEIIRGLQSTMATQLEFSYYRTIDKSELDLVVQGAGGPIPIEIKLGSTLKRLSLRGLSNFLADTKAPFGLVVNRGRRVALLTENIVQIPVHYL